ncbi:MAG TPA: YcgN family cysteine cluster protein [Gammaproteobacteria bacterium]|nr:YcgN family cysteine cluster protein [Gammaproteobacteria bacterium]
MAAFWETKALEEMDPQEWESLCDGCAQCCLQKLEDAETGEVFITQVACALLNLETCQCTEYDRRSELVPSCVTMTAKQTRAINWMPKSCAYRLLAENKSLPSWHPLLSGKQYSVIEADASIKDKAVSEKDILEKDWPNFIVEQLI